MKTNASILSGSRMNMSKYTLTQGIDHNTNNERMQKLSEKLNKVSVSYTLTLVRH
jgi:hypothetical protein